MLKLRINYSDENEKDKFINELQHKFKIIKVSKEYKKEGPYRRIHIDLEDKKISIHKGTDHNSQL
jgi:hypothetical protein